MSDFRIRVTQEDIDSGHQAQAYDCAIARALRRQIPYAACISVGITQFNIDTQTYHNTQEMQEFVRAFDRCKELVFPQEFLINLDEALVRA
jgi:hypothetical protein